MAPVERGEGLAVELKLHDHDRACRSSVDLMAFLPVACDLSDPGILEDGRAALRRVFGLVVEP
jgi:hypothetical protein